VWGNCQDILTRVGLKLVKLGIFPKLRIFAGGLRGCTLGGVRVWGILRTFFLKFCKPWLCSFLSNDLMIQLADDI
jgi:hypothetical protein